MTKQINITYDDKIYALEYNRKTVKAMEGKRDFQSEILRASRTRQ